MDIKFRSKKLANILNSEHELRRTYGKDMGETIENRLKVLKAASCLEEVPKVKPERMHALSGERKGHYAVDLKHPYRLIFKPNVIPLPKKPDGSVDLAQIREIIILEVTDYHH